MTELSLSVEQHFAINTFNRRANTLSREQAQEELVCLYEKMIRMENDFNMRLSQKEGVVLGIKPQK